MDKSIPMKTVMRLIKTKTKKADEKKSPTLNTGGIRRCKVKVTSPDFQVFYLLSNK